MIYPEFLKKNDLIGISAPSMGVGHKLETFDLSLERLRSEGYQIIETEHVRVDNPRGGTARQRGVEFSSLFANPEVNCVISAAGGDFLFEILPYVDWHIMKKNPKWLCGASDPTSLLFTYTVRYDIATMYGFNAGSFSEDPIPENVQNSLKFLKGKLPVQKTSTMYASKPGFADDYEGPDTPTEWKSNQKTVSLSGRCIGGCIDVFKDLIGTEYDTVKKFIRKYKDDGFIWYFDNFSMCAESFYRTLLQMKYAGWLDDAKAILVGRVLFPSSETGMSYEEALQLAFPDLPVIYEMDIGHTEPSFTMINGAIANVSYRNGKGKVSFELK
jgi:muramoyltetrapeptide carboxypeptidase LdcA involved in peptidoglycan recycling